MTFNARARRRWFGTLCLLAALIMLLAGDRSPGERMGGLTFVFYWLGCLGLTILAMLAAILDARALRREAREEQRSLLADAMRDIRKEKGRKGNGD